MAILKLYEYPHPILRKKCEITCILYVFGYKIAEIIDIFVKMNTNTTQNALQCFCMEAEQIQARAKATTSSHDVQPVPRSSDEQQTRTVPRLAPGINER